MSKSDRKIKLVLGTIGGDTHVVGVKILAEILAQHGYSVTSLGAMVPPEDFISAAIEVAADGILVSSLAGNAEFYCRDLRGMCVEAGLGTIKMYLGGNISIGHGAWPEVEAKFLAIGFDRAFPPQTKAQVLLQALDADFQLSA